MSPSRRKLVLVVLGLGIVGALAAYLARGPRLSSLGMAAFLILIWTPVKGLLYRRLGGARPYQSALAANASSEIVGLPFRLGLSFWPLMGVSFLVSAAIETLALTVMGTAPSLRRTSFLAFYGSFVVHLLTVGWFASQRSLALGLPFLVVGILLVHLPTFFPEEWLESPSSGRA